MEFNNENLLKALIQKKDELQEQLTAAENAIVAFGGRRKVKSITPTEKKPSSRKRRAPRSIGMGERVRRKLSNTESYVVEIVNDAKKPVDSKKVHRELKKLGITYKIQSVRALLPVLHRAGYIKRHSEGLYTSCKVKVSTEKPSLKKKVITIKEVSEYIQIRGQVKRQELISFFVKGGLLTENQVQARVEKLIKQRKVRRKEHGAYQWCS